MDHAEFEQLLQQIKSNSVFDIPSPFMNAITPKQAGHLAEALKINNSIDILSLNNIRLEDEGAEAIAEALKSNNSIVSLKLDNNFIEDAGAEAIAETLKSNNSIESLYLNNNRIGNIGARAIAEALKSNNSLTELYLNNNEIGNIGARAIAEALKINNSIVSLKLDNNFIDDEGAAAIAEALKINNSITSLYLNNNTIGDRGAEAIAEALKSNNSLTELYLNNNEIGNIGARAIAEALKINNSITVIEPLIDGMKIYLEANGIIQKGDLLMNFNLEEVIKFYKQALQKAPAKTDIHMKIVGCHIKLHQYKQALDYLRSNDDCEEYINLLISEGDFLYQHRMTDKALRHFEQAFEYLEASDGQIAEDKLIEQKLHLHHTKALIYFEAGDTENAIESLKQALTLSPDDPTIMSNLGWVLLVTEDTNHIEEAIGYFQKISCLKGESLANNRLGEIYFNAGRYAEAVTYFENALKLQNNDLFKSNLGRAYLCSDKLQEALNCFEQINENDKELYNITLEQREITLNELLKEAEAACERSGNDVEDLQIVKGYYDRLIKLCESNNGREEYRLKQGLYLGKEAKFVMEKFSDFNTAAVLADLAIYFYPDCPDAQEVIIAVEATGTELAGNCDDSMEL